MGQSDIFSIVGHSFPQSFTKYVYQKSDWHWIWINIQKKPQFWIVWGKKLKKDYVLYLCINFHNFKIKQLFSNVKWDLPLKVMLNYPSIIKSTKF